MQNDIVPQTMPTKIPSLRLFLPTKKLKKQLPTHTDTLPNVETVPSETSIPVITKANNIKHAIVVTVPIPTDESQIYNLLFLKLLL